VLRGFITQSPTGNAAWRGQIQPGTRIALMSTPIGIQAMSLGVQERGGRGIPYWSFWDPSVAARPEAFDLGTPMLEAEGADGAVFLAFPERPASGVELIRTDSTHNLGNVGTRIRAFEMVVPMDGVYWSNHTGQIGGRADTPAAVRA